MWIPITLAAATFQILRTARQHRLRDLLSLNEAGFVRYAYGLPWALLACAITFVALGRDVPSIPLRFWWIVAGAGVAQILGTVALLRSFDLRDFAIGTVYSKSEVILVAIVSAVALGEPLAAAGWIGAAICVAGLGWLAAPSRIADALRLAGDPAALMGVLAALGFALAAAGLRGASTSLDGGSTWDRAILTLTAMLTIQTLINGTQIRWSERDSLASVAAAWRPAMSVGVLSMAGSASWTLAFTLTNVAKVRTLGQVELVLAFAVSAWWLRERHVRAEYLASGLVLLGVIAVVALG
ncbi:MAG: EamA/RhaT family transporter [Actinomycetota bacterium]